MENNKNIELSLKWIGDNFADVFLKIIAREEFRLYSEIVLEQLSKEVPDLLFMYDYGVEHLPQDDVRPDRSAADYFLIISEIKDLKNEVRSFATDAMVYAENGNDVPAETKEQLRKTYMEKIRPLLSK